MHIFALRHTSVAVKKGICYGLSDVELAHTFESEAAEVLKKINCRKFDTVYTSPLSRCRKLAEKIDSYPELDRRLLELDFGLWELRLWDELFKNDSYAKKWMDNYLELPAPEGESFNDMHKRVHDFVDEIAKSGYERILLVTHSGVIRILYNLLRNVDSEKLFSLDIPFGSLHDFGL